MWHYKYKLEMFQEFVRRFFFLFELFKLIAIYMKLWLEDRVLYEYYIYKYIKNKKFKIKFLTSKLLKNYFKYKKLLNLIKRKLIFKYQRKVQKLKKLLIGYYGHQKRYWRIFPQYFKYNRYLKYKMFRLFGDAINNKKFKMDKKFKKIKNFEKEKKKKNVISGLLVRYRYKQNLKIYNKITYTLGNKLDIDLSNKLTKTLTPHKIKYFKKQSRLFLNMINELYGMNTYMFKKIFIKILSFNKNINSWYEFFILLESNYNIFIKRLFGKSIKYINTFKKENDFIQIGELIQFKKFFFLNNLDYKLFKSISLLFFLLKNNIFIDNYIIPIFIKINKNILIFYKKLKLLKLIFIKKIKFNNFFIKRLKKKFKVSNLMFLFDYYLNRHIIFKMTTLNNLKLIPIRLKQLLILKKLFKYRFCRFFYKRLKNQIQFGFSFKFPFGKKTIRLPHFTKYKLNITHTGYWYRVNTLKYIKKALKRQFFKFNFKKRRKQGILICYYISRFKKLFNKKKLMFITKNPDYILKKWNFELPNIKMYSVIKYKLQIKLLKKYMRHPTIFLFQFRKININKKFKNKWYWKFKYWKKKRIFFIVHYNYWKKLILKKRKKKYKINFIYKIKFNIYIYDNYYKLLYNQCLNYNKFLLEYKINNNIYFIVYNIPFFEVIMQLNTLIKDKNILTNSLPNLTLFKKYYL
jgi:hypothetical protein